MLETGMIEISVCREEDKNKQGCMAILGLVTAIRGKEGKERYG
jgi:hypothetical protein